MKKLLIIAIALILMSTINVRNSNDGKYYPVYTKMEVDNLLKTIQSATTLKDSIAKIRAEYKTALKDTSANMRKEYQAFFASLEKRLSNTDAAVKMNTDTINAVKKKRIKISADFGTNAAGDSLYLVK
jgi:hypothetical protein